MFRWIAAARLEYAWSIKSPIPIFTKTRTNKRFSSSNKTLTLTEQEQATLAITEVTACPLEGQTAKVSRRHLAL